MRQSGIPSEPAPVEEAAAPSGVKVAWHPEGLALTPAQSGSVGWLGSEVRGFIGETTLKNASGKVVTLNNQEKVPMLGT